MSHLLDTNACIAIVNRRPTQVRHRMAEARRNGAVFYSSVVSAYEIEVGILKSDRSDETRRQYDLLWKTVTKLEFNDEDALTAAAIRADLERKGQPIGSYDYLIAAQALHRDWVLVTANEREFLRVKGLTVENWAR